MAAVTLKYLQLYTVTRGARRYKVANYRRGGVATRLLAEDGRPVDADDAEALVAAWTRADKAWGQADAKAAAAAEARVVRPRSIADLIARYRSSPEWDILAPATRGNYEKSLVPLERDFGTLPVAGLDAAHVTRIRDRYAWRQVPDADRPGEMKRVPNAFTANHRVTVLSLLMSFAVNPLGWRKDNPALKPKRLKTFGEGHRPWTREEYLRFVEHADPEWQFAALLALLSNQRGQDQVAMKWTDWDGVSLYVRQQKGRGTVQVWIEAHPLLKAALDKRRREMLKRSPAPLTILCRADGTPWPKNAFEKAAGKAIRSAGLTGVVWHGLRATGSSWATEGGAADGAVQALAGHKTPAMSKHYARGADRKRLAASAAKAIVVPMRVKVRKGKV